MRLKQIFGDVEVKKAISLGGVCMISYLACYFARNILSAATPQMLEDGVFTLEIIGVMSTACMIAYAIGQLINGVIGDKVPTKYMVSGGLLLSGVCNAALPLLPSAVGATVAYAMSGFFLSMLFAPITKVVSENTIPRYATRCCLGFTFASIFGTPLAGVAAVLFDWDVAFIVCSIILAVMGGGCFLFFTFCERKGWIVYRKQAPGEKKRIDVKLLVRRGIIRFALIAVLTGIVRTSVVFWIPTYLAQHLGYSAVDAAAIFSGITLIKSLSPYVNNLAIYEMVMKRRMTPTLLFMFGASTVCFMLMYFVTVPLLNIIILTLALFTSAGAATMLFSIYCPSLRDTGNVSSATGFLDFMSYIAAAVANLLFTDAISSIGWGPLILIWAGLMAVGFIISLPFGRRTSPAADAEAR
ncbi:MAG: MFS transporter [Clostridia bacterium]|nr:MFS transporter [Clostridia bacterium]